MKSYILPKKVGTVDKTIAFPICNLIDTFFVNNKITPNMITIITLILRLYIFHKIENNSLSKFEIIIYLISWITDALDGHIARNYNMKTKLGAKLDFFVDMYSHYLLIFGLFKFYYKGKKKLLFKLILIHFFIFINVGSKDLSDQKEKDIKGWELFWFKLTKKYNIKQLLKIKGFSFGPGLGYLFFGYILFTAIKNN